MSVGASRKSCTKKLNIKNETMPNQPLFSRIEIDPGRHLHCLYEGRNEAPFVLFDAGAFGIYADGWWVKEALKKKFGVCLYDRAGMGASDPVPEGITPSPDFHVEDIRKLVRALGVTTKIILIGHSMSGLRLHTFVNLYREEIRGVIFVDALSPRQLTNTHGKFLGQQFAWILKAGVLGAKLGLAETVSKIAPNNFALDGAIRADKVWSYASESHHAASRDEVLAVDYEADYLHGDGITKLPLAIFTSTLVNGMNESDADIAQKNTGYGWFGAFPKENHVSILLGEHADLIADRVVEIAAL